MKLITLFLTFFCCINANSQDFQWVKGEGPNGWRERVVQGSGLKVMWWNLGCRNNSSLIKNINSIIDLPYAAPDVLIFGEYCPYKLQEKKSGLIDRIIESYPHAYQVSQYTPLHNKPVNGMRIFSRYKIEKISKVLPKASNWLNGNDMSKCVAARPNDPQYKKQRYQFPVINFRVTKNSKKYNISAIHFPNPWNAMAKCRGKLKTLVHLIRGKTNPTYQQALFLRNYHIDSERTLLIGDFNAPKSIKILFFRFISKTYSFLRNNFGPSVIKSHSPTANSQTGSYSIDHAFASDDLKVNFAEVLQLSGSDHKPIYVKID